MSEGNIIQGGRKAMVVIDERGNTVKVGDTVTSFRGNRAIVKSLNPERNRVTTSPEGSKSQFDCQEYFLGVYDLKIKEGS